MKLVYSKQHWSGYFTYPIYDEKGELTDEEYRVPFTMNINIHEQSFTGTAIDEESKHLFDNPATIKGFIEKNLFSFIKQYPCYYFINEDGELAADKTKQHPEIRYTGFLNEAKNEVVGEWEMGPTPSEEGYWGDFELKKITHE